MRKTLLPVMLMTATAFGQGLNLFEHPMSESAKTEIKAALKKMSLEQLGAALAAETSPQRIWLIVKDLSSRGPDAAPILKEFRKSRTSIDPATRMVLADVEIALAQIGRTGADYVKSLDNLLSTGDKYVVDAVANELKQVGTAEALAALKSREQNGRPSIKIARLQLEFGDLPAEGRVAAILESARSTIREHKGNIAPALIAEGSILMWLGENAEPLMKQELTAVLSNSESEDAAGQQYRAFLEGVLQDLHRAQVMKRTATTMPIATMPTTSVSALPVPATTQKSAEPLAPVPSQPAGSRSGAAVTAPEDRGEDFSPKPVDELVSILVESQDIIARRKAAKVLGDQELAGSLRLSDEQRTALERYIKESLLADVASKDAAKRSEANAQIQRLWRLTSAVLIRHVADQNMSVVDASTKNLILMRDEAIIRELIERAKGVNGRARVIYLVTLGKMTERRESRIPERTCMSAEESVAIASKLIEPFLLQVAQQADPELQMLVERAVKELEQQAPAGVWVRTTQPTTRKNGEKGSEVDPK